MWNKFKDFANHNTGVMLLCVAIMGFILYKGALFATAMTSLVMGPTIWTTCIVGMTQDIGNTEINTLADAVDMACQDFNTPAECDYARGTWAARVRLLNLRPGWE